MIPQDELKYLTPLPDMVKRRKMIEGKLHHPLKRLQSPRFRTKNHTARDHVGIGSRG
jgi:hypothetical protein